MQQKAHNWSLHQLRMLHDCTWPCRFRHRTWEHLVQCIIQAKSVPLIFMKYNLVRYSTLNAIRLIRISP
jgi:hypothetical protein